MRCCAPVAAISCCAAIGSLRSQVHEAPKCSSSVVSVLQLLTLIQE